MWKPTSKIDYSKYYNRNIKITYIDSYGDKSNNFIKFEKGKLFPITTNKHGNTSICILTQRYHNYKKYVYESSLTITNNLIKTIHIEEPEIRETIFILAKYKLNENMYDEIHKYIDAYREI